VVVPFPLPFPFPFGMNGFGSPPVLTRSPPMKQLVHSMKTMHPVARELPLLGSVVSNVSPLLFTNR
jgi:hypothetical protein